MTEMVTSTTVGTAGMQAGQGAVGSMCGICGQGRLERMCETVHGTVVRCAGCKTARTIFREKEQSSQERYDEPRWLETRRMLARHLGGQARRRYARLGRFSPGRDLLEIGCSTGEFLEAARKKGHRVTGVEISPKVVEYLRDNRPELDVRNCRLEEAGFAPGSFDVVAAFHLLEHIDDPNGFLLQVRELLRPGGLLYVRVPNLDSWFRKMFGPSWWGFSDSHVWHFTAEGLMRLMDGAFFDVLESGNYEDSRESYWPVLPLLAGRGRIIRKVGNLVAPGGVRRGGETCESRDARRRIKKALLYAYFCYRWLGSKALLPFIGIQSQCGGGSELYAVARKAGA